MKGTNTVLLLNEHDHRRQVEVRIDQQIEVRLEENPTAGFRWRLVESGEPVCSLVGDVFEPGGKPGQPGVHFWRFRIMAAGSARIEMLYRRSWQAQAAAARHFSIKLKSTAP